MINNFEHCIRETTGGLGLRAAGLDTIQVNVGLKCNLNCAHCHLGSSPSRTETMTWKTMQRVLEAARRARVRVVDLTGGAPELHPHFRPFAAALAREGFEVLVRTNLTVFHEPGREDMPRFYREHQIHLIASLPCYLEENVDAQRGSGTFHKSISSIRELNRLGYGRGERWKLDLVYNPIGDSLPPEPTALEADYKRALSERYGIAFNRLVTITNMPIGRFLGRLKEENRRARYLRLLRDSYNSRTADDLMCRRQISVRWDGALFDCDFNLALRLPVGGDAPAHIEDFEPDALKRRRIVTGDHCFGCTAGHGSSCGGALVGSSAGPVV